MRKNRRVTGSQHISRMQLKSRAHCPSTKESAYILAMVNQHKTWARRWLRQNGYNI